MFFVFVFLCFSQGTKTQVEEIEPKNGCHRFGFPFALKAGNPPKKTRPIMIWGDVPNYFQPSLYSNNQALLLVWVVSGKDPEQNVIECGS